MTRPIRYSALGLAIIACVALAAVLRSDARAQAPRPSTPVLVVNTSAERVPVQSTLQPVQNAEFGSFATGDRFSSEEELYTVPAGKTLVIEGFSVSSNLAAVTERLDATLRAEFGDSTIPMNWHLAPTDLGVASTGARIFGGRQS